MSLRCEASVARGDDPTGEKAIACNAPAEYCPVCEINICAGCHSEITGACIPHVRKPPVAASAQDQRNQADRIRNG